MFRCLAMATKRKTTTPLCIEFGKIKCDFRLLTSWLFCTIVIRSGYIDKFPWFPYQFFESIKGNLLETRGTWRQYCDYLCSLWHYMSSSSFSLILHKIGFDPVRIFFKGKVLFFSPLYFPRWIGIAYEGKWNSHQFARVCIWQGNVIVSVPKIKYRSSCVERYTYVHIK